MEVEDVVNSIQTAIDAHRTDILKTVLDTVRKGWSYNDFVQTLNQPLDRGTFLHIVTQNNQADMVRVLLSYGADPTLPNSQGKTPVSVAATEHTKTAFVDALFASIAQNNMNTTQKLLLSGLEANIRDNPDKQNTPLHWAVSFSNMEAIIFLAEQGAVLDCPNSKGLTPLHEAVLAGQCDIVQLLIKLGAKVNFPVQGTSEMKGKTAFELAKPESPVMALLARHQVPNGQVSQHMSLELNGHHSAFQSICNRSNDGAASPVETESVFSTEEMSASLPLLRVPVRPVITDTRLHWLWPPPKQMQQLPGAAFLLNQPWTITFVGCTIPLHQILDIWDVHKPQLTSLGINPTIFNASDAAPCRVTCCVKSRLFTSSESYRLTITSERIAIVCADANGLHYALNTLEQLITLCLDDGRIPALHIDDSPSIRMRSILLDISINGRVPLLDALFSMVDAWQSLKINQLHLFTRFDTAVLSASFWPWPYTKTEILSLDRYCVDRGLDLVPALEIHGDSSTFDLQSFQGILATTRSCFPSTSYIHAGPHLTSILIDQFQCASSSLLESMASSHGLTWFLCANSIREKNVAPGSVDPSVILTEYGFQADYNFHEMSQSAYQASASMCFCAGTASWDCLSSYPDAAAANILHAVQAAVDRGSLGSITATWTDAVALGSLHFAWPGWILHAGLSWNPSVHWDFIQNSLGDLMSLWILNENVQDGTFSLGTTIIELGRLETWLLRYSRGELDSENLIEATCIPPSLPPREGSMHYQLLVDPDCVSVDHLNMECVSRALRHAKKWHKILTEYSTSPSARLSFTKTIISQAILTADFILVAGRIARGILATGCNPNSNMGVHAINLGVANLTPTLRTDVANRLLSLAERFKQLWSQQYQVPSSGLNSVLTALTNSTKRLLAHPGYPDI